MEVAGVEQPLVLSPMVDVTDAAFRSIAKEWGADVTCSEMVSAAGLVHDNTTSWELAKRWPGETPYGVQIMGGDAEQMAEAVRLVNQRIGPDFIDLNLGCPSPNILRSCAGGFLLRDPKLAGKVIGAAVDAADRTPVSVKLRTGPSNDRPTYLEVGQAAESAGAAWCTLHGRSVEQMYAGQADWQAIGKMVDGLGIPVVGNGDIREPQDVLRMWDETGCAGYFIARAAMNDPTIFRRMRQALDGKTAEAGPELSRRQEVFAEYLRRYQTLGEPRVAELRRQATRFMSGVPGAREVRKRLHEATTVEGIAEVMLA